MKPGCSHRIIVVLIVGTFSFVTILHFATLCWCAIHGIEPPVKVSENMKDLGLVALGALGTILSQTRGQQDTQNVNVTNPPSQPVPTTENTNHAPIL